MFFRSVRPPQHLAEFVDNIWLYEGYEAAHTNERILPSGTIELVFNLREDEIRIYRTDDLNECSRYSGAVVSGPYKHGFASDTTEEAFIMGVHFSPGGAFPFLGVSGDELTNAHVDLDQLWGRSARDLRDRVCEAPTAREKFRIVEDALLDHLSRPLERHYAVFAALESLDDFQEESVREMAKSVGLSERRFIDVFRSEVGLTPKVFGRIHRFQRLRQFIETTQEIDWPAVASIFGYFDQSHMIREFQEFSGTTPAAYLRRHVEFVEQSLHIKTNHLPTL